MTTAKDEILLDNVSEALVGGASPDGLQSWQFAYQVVPALRLLRVLVSTTNEADSLVKLMLLFELAHTGGRWPIERIRSAVPYLAPERVDPLVRTLTEAGWLELRAVDRTYRFADMGLHVLRMLQVADFAGLADSNVVHRAALAAEFANRGQEGQAATGWLLDQLLVQLEDAVDEATSILRQGRPWELLAWSRREHRVQLDSIRQVLGFLQERIDASASQFLRIERLHHAMQGIIRQHAGIHTRLRDWNLERLYTSDAGYSVPELAEAVLGADPATLIRLLGEGILQPKVQPADLTVSEIRARLQAARRKLMAQDEWRYQPPAEPMVESLVVAEVDPAAALRARLTGLLAERPPHADAMEVEEWLTPDDFASGAWDMALLSRLQAAGADVVLDDRSVAHSEQRAATGKLTLVGQLQTWVEQGVLRRATAGHFARVRISREAADE